MSRMTKVLGCAVLLALLVAVAPANASIRFGAALGGGPVVTAFCTDCTIVNHRMTDGTSRAAPVAGVITRWRVRVTAPGELRIVVARATSEGRRYLAAAQTVTAAGTDDVETFPARVTVQRDDDIGLSSPGRVDVRSNGNHLTRRFEPALTETPVAGNGLGGIEAPVAADIEPDADRDGYGDETQDACPEDPARHDGACSGTLVGAEVTGAWSFSSLIPTGPDHETFVGAAGPSAGVVPADGVLVRWRVRAWGGNYALQVLRPSGTAVAGVHTAPYATTLPTDSESIWTTPTRIAVRAGDLVGVRGTVGLHERDTAAATSYRIAPAIADGATAEPGASLGKELAIAADLEPDADRDGFGDVTQDGCPASAARQDPCPVTTTPPPAPQPPGQIVLLDRPPALRIVERPGSARVAVARLRYRGRTTLTVPLVCPATSTGCAGTLELRVGGKRAGTVRFRIRAGGRASYRVPLNARARRALRRRASRVAAIVTPAGMETARRSLKLTR